MRFAKTRHFSFFTMIQMCLKCPFDTIILMQMRARIASLTSRKSRNGISKTDREVSSSPSPDGRATLRASHREKVTGNTTNDESEDLVESDVEDPLIEPESAPAIQVKNKRQARENNRKASEARARRMFNSLPVEQQEYIWNVLVVAVAENVENHPLASSVSSQLKQEAVLEVSLQVREILASVLVLPINEMQVGKNKNESDLVISQDALHAMLIRALSFTPGRKFNSISMFPIILKNKCSCCILQKYSGD